MTIKENLNATKVTNQTGDLRNWPSPSLQRESFQNVRF